MQYTLLLPELLCYAVTVVACKAALSSSSRLLKAKRAVAVGAPSVLIHCDSDVDCINSMISSCVTGRNSSGK
jgi:hypothetical protein